VQLHRARLPRPLRSCAFPPGRAPPPPLLALVVPKRRNIEQRKEGPKGMDNTLMSYEQIRQVKCDYTAMMCDLAIRY